MDILSILREVTKPKQGNRPNFDEAHVILTLTIIYAEQPIGRPTLMKRLGLGEATTRTLLRRLKELDLIRVDKVGGTELTETGKKLIEMWNSRIYMEKRDLKTINWNSIMVVAKNEASLLDKIKVLELRDMIIKAGANAALIAVVKNGHIEIPPKTNEFSIKGLLEEIKIACSSCQDGDLIVFITPDDMHIAYKVGLLLFESWSNN